MKSGKFDWDITPAKDRIVIQIFPDGRMQIGNGHHRIYATRLLGEEIPWTNKNAVVFEQLPTGQPGYNLGWEVWTGRKTCGKEF